jgi:hypothetical protein
VTVERPEHYVGTGITPTMTHAAPGIGSQYTYTVDDANGGRGIAVDVLRVASVDQDRLTRDLRAALADAGLTEASVKVRVIPGLRRDVKTGKLAQFVAA